MCGIGGILRIWPADQRDLALRTPHARSIPEQWLEILDDSIKHRGPDGHGRFRDRAIRPDGSVTDVALVHRRLSIIDHAGGAQPMVHDQRGAGLWPAESLEAWNTRLGDSGAHEPTPASDRLAVVFNGCIYNHRELRAELRRAGHAFTTDHSDTEALIHGWREWGESLLPRLDGMFALAVWDACSGSLVIARDRCGEKPLHDLRLGGVPNRPGQTLIFSSAPGPLVLLGDVLTGDAGSDLDPGMLRNWAHFGFAAHPPSESLTTVPPAALVKPQSWAPGAYMPERYWRPPSRDPRTPLTADSLEPILDRAVASRLEADVSLGCFLSGGVDSSLIATLARRHLGELRTFTVRMPDDRYDESAQAQRVADHLRTRHTTLECFPPGSPAPAEDLVRLIRQLGLPLGDSSLLPTFWVSRAARQVVKVALSGDGGDELFCGYDRYRAAALLRRFRRLIAAAPGGLLPVSDPRSSTTRAARLIRAARGNGYTDLLRIFDVQDAAALGLRVHGRSADLPPSNTERSSPWPADQPRPDEDPPRFDFEVYLPQDLLAKVDTASMAVALEVRAPFLAAEVVQAALATPIDLLTPRGRGGGRKGLLRTVARKHLPPEIVDRPKMGFAIPIGEWFRTDFGGLRTLLLDHLNSAEPFGPPSLGIELNTKFVRRMLDEHLGTGPSGLVKRDHAQRLYMLLVLSIWAKWVSSQQSVVSSKQ